MAPTETLNVTVDVIGQMENTRKSFADRMAFVDELIQNAQRGKAENIYVKIEDNRITFEDDGEGCTDMSLLFTQSLSGWNQEIKENEDPFGFGFFSCMVVSDKITVQSHGVEAEFDVAKMFREHRTDVVDIHRSDIMLHRGFRVILESLIDVRRWQVADRVKKLARYIKPRVHMNGEVIAKHSFNHLTDAEQDIFAVTVLREKGFEGVVYPNTWGDLETFLHGRPVESLYGVRGLGGRLNITNNAMNPRCPDRKAWIKDSKYYAFTRKLKRVAKRLMLHIVTDGTDDMIDQFSEQIKSHLRKSEYRKHLRFDIDLDPRELKAVEKANKKSIEEAASIDELLDKVTVQMREERPDIFDDFSDPLSAPTPPPPAEDTPEVENVAEAPVWTREAAPQPVTVAEVSRKHGSNARRAGRSYKALRQTKRVYWVRRSEIMENIEAIREARYYGARVLVVRNRLQHEVVQDMPNVLPISKLRKSMKLGFNIIERGYRNDAEHRAEKILNAVASIFNGPTVEVAELETFTEVHLNDQAMGKREPIEALAAWKDGVIYIQRAQVESEVLEGIDLDAPMGEIDRAFVMSLLDELSHELTHALYGLPDGDVNFYKTQLQIQNKIIRVVFSEVMSRKARAILEEAKQAVEAKIAAQAPTNVDKHGNVYGMTLFQAN